MRLSLNRIYRVSTQGLISWRCVCEVFFCFCFFFPPLLSPSHPSRSNFLAIALSIIVSQDARLKILPKCKFEAHSKSIFAENHTIHMMRVSDPPFPQFSFFPSRFFNLLIGLHIHAYSQMRSRFFARLLAAALAMLLVSKHKVLVVFFNDTQPSPSKALFRLLHL